jgi:hypothetical protein
LTDRRTAFYEAVAVDPDEIAPWIDELRGRIGRGELKHLLPIVLDSASVDAELIACIMLTELEDLDALPADERDQPDLIARRRTLLWDLLWLREQIG